MIGVTDLLSWSYQVCSDGADIGTMDRMYEENIVPSVEIGAIEVGLHSICTIFSEILSSMKRGNLKEGSSVLWN